MKTIIGTLIFCFFLTYTGFAQSNGDCLDCHDDPELTMTKDGKEILLDVNPKRFSASAHKEVTCIECHVGFDPDEEPHKEVITPVDCASCHEEAAKDFTHSGHFNEISCTSCHENIHRPEQLAQIITKCEDCHKQPAADFKSSIHFTDANGPACYDCHSPHRAEIAGAENCLSCHAETEFAEKNGKTDKLDFIRAYQESIHAENIECSDCHSSHAIFPVDSSASPVNRQNIVQTCNECHDDVVVDFLASEHGKAFESGFENAPNCSDCHGEHEIYPITDSRSEVSRQHEVDACLKCHLDTPEVTERMTHSAGFIAGYETSIHGRKFYEGDSTAAICSDCHGAHTPMKASDANSLVSKFNIAATCGKCHEEIAAEFEASIHGEALLQDIKDVPTCTDCHGEHNILEPALAASPVAPQNVSQEVCGPCHESVKLTQKYGISSDRFSAYNDSYHGLAVRFGDVEAANCASCHGVHNILASTDPNSSIHPENLAVTCGECHPGANKNFAIGKVHITGEADNDQLIYWISTIYIILIVGTIGAMLLHNLLDWIRKMKEKYQERYYTPAHYPSKSVPKKFVRMTLEDRIQHWGLIVSFFALVITGFMLTFPEAWWVIWIRKAGGEGLFELRGLLHRIAAVVMIAVTLYHTYYCLFTNRGRQFIRDMRFGWQDIKDMVVMLKYNLGLSKTRPRFGRFNYIEKSEYWALVWGTAIMTLTGIALWFENQSMAWFSKLFVDACETIHYFEAWLAFLAIVVWHFYYVIFNPDVYPMNFTWLTGKVTEEEMEHEHPLELEQLRKEEEEIDS